APSYPPTRSERLPGPCWPRPGSFALASSSLIGAAPAAARALRGPFLWWQRRRPRAAWFGRRDPLVDQTVPWLPPAERWLEWLLIQRYSVSLRAIRETIVRGIRLARASSTCRQAAFPFSRSPRLEPTCRT